MIRIRLADRPDATLEAGRWQCADARLEQLLNAMRAPWSASEAQPELYEARVASKVLGARIVEAF